MFRVEDTVRIKKCPAIWGKVVGIIEDHGLHYVVRGNWKGTLLCEEDEIEPAPLEALADVGNG
jgi:hypothetical protein